MTRLPEYESVDKFVACAPGHILVTGSLYFTSTFDFVSEEATKVAKVIVWGYLRWILRQHRPYFEQECKQTILEKPLDAS